MELYQSLIIKLKIIKLKIIKSNYLLHKNLGLSIEELKKKAHIENYFYMRIFINLKILNLL